MPRQRPLNPVGLTALITGASSGIGLEIARRHARLGGTPVLVARSGDTLRSTARDMLDTHGIDAPVIEADLARPDGAERLWRTIMDRSLAIDLLVNNAGFGGTGRVWERPFEDERDMIRLNVESLANLTRLALPGMVARGRGAILNVGSMAGFVAGPRMATYYATKAFVLSYTEALAEELEGTGVTATVLAPGPVKTGFQKRARFRRGTDMEKRALAAKEVAEAGYAGMLRGETIVIPGRDNRVGAALFPFIPRGMRRRMIGRINTRLAG